MPWLPGCLAAWLPGCQATWPPSFSDASARQPDWLVAFPTAYLTVKVPACLLALAAKDQTNNDSLLTSLAELFAEIECQKRSPPCWLAGYDLIGSQLASGQSAES